MADIPTSPEPLSLETEQLRNRLASRTSEHQQVTEMLRAHRKAWSDRNVRLDDKGKRELMTSAEVTAYYHECQGLAHQLQKIQAETKEINKQIRKQETARQAPLERDRNKRLYADFKTGLSLKVLSERYNISRPRVRQIAANMERRESRNEEAWENSTISFKEACEYLGVSYGILNYALQKGRVKASKYGSRRFKKEELDRLKPELVPGFLSAFHTSARELLAPKKYQMLKESSEQKAESDRG